LFEPAVGLLRRGLVRLSPAAARMLASPGADLSAVENTVVVRVHLVESCGSASPRPVLGTVHVLLSRDAASG